MKKRALLIFLTLLTLQPKVSKAADNACEDWFKEKSINSSSKDCIIRCSTASVSVGTAECHDWCDSFCNYKCTVSGKWKSKLKDRVNKRDLSLSVVPFTSKEREMVFDSLSRISNSFPVVELEGIYKGAKPASPLLALNPASYIDQKIILYPRAFDSAEKLTRILVHELAHQLHESTMHKAFLDYQKQVGWQTGEPRPGKFIEPDCKDSPEEDFAKNFETYIFEPNILKEIVPSAYRWMSKNLKDKYKLKECVK